MAGGHGGCGGREPDLSVILPAYNAAEYLERAVLSVCRQADISNFEILIVDDASQDGTGAIARRLARVDGRIKCFHSETNRGPSASRNIALDAARGRWIAVLDADDAFSDHRMQRLIEIGERYECHVVSDNLSMTQRGFASRPMFPFEGDEAPVRMSPPKFVSGCMYPRGSTGRMSYGFLKPIVRRSFLEQHGLRYDEGVRNGEDMLLYLRVLRAGAAWMHTPAPMYHYHVRDESLAGGWAWDARRALIASLGKLAAEAIDGTEPLGKELDALYRLFRDDYIYNEFRQGVVDRRRGETSGVVDRHPNARWIILLEILKRAPGAAYRTCRGAFRKRIGASARIELLRK